MASQPEHHNLYITTTTITTYDHYTGVVIIDTVWTGTWLGQQIFQNVEHRVIHPESNSAPESAPSTTPRPPPFVYLGPGELVSVAREDPPNNGIPESPVLSRQNGLAARVRNNAASTRGREQAPLNIPYTLGQARQLTPAERLLERARADVARWNNMTRTSINTDGRGRTILRPQLLAGVPEVLQRDASYTYIRQGRVIRQVPNESMPSESSAHRANNNTSNTRRHNNRDETATITPNLTDYSRRRTRAMLRRRHGSVDIGDSSLLDGEIAELEGHVALRPSTARGSSGALSGYGNAGNDGA
ncbi:hypothetical protein KCU95_g5591, partial [Aureobasidium melanogenum]